MFAKLRPRSAYDVMAALALFLVVAGGSAYAVATITGADVVDESLTGADVRGKAGTSTTAAVNGSLTTNDIAGQQANAANGTPFVDGTLTQWDIKNNSLTGSDVLESSLAKVPNADKLDGIDSTGLVQGRGTLLSNRLVSVPVFPGGRRTLLQIAGLGELSSNCTSTQGAQIEWFNTTASTIDVWVSRNDGSRQAGLVGPSGIVNVVDTDLSRPGGTLALGLGNDPGPRRIATLHAFAFQSDDGAPCGFQAQGTLWVSP